MAGMLPAVGSFTSELLMIDYGIELLVFCQERGVMSRGIIHNSKHPKITTTIGRR
jgi:hypothetical protein